MGFDIKRMDIYRKEIVIFSKTMTYKVVILAGRFPKTWHNRQWRGQWSPYAASSSSSSCSPQSFSTLSALMSSRSCLWQIMTPQKSELVYNHICREHTKAVKWSDIMWPDIFLSIERRLTIWCSLTLTHTRIPVRINVSIPRMKCEFLGIDIQVKYDLYSTLNSKPLNLTVKEKSILSFWNIPYFAGVLIIP